MLLITIFFTIVNTGFSQQDAEGCKDHPLFSRMPGYYISECTNNYNQLDFYNAQGEDVKLEGNLTYAWYIFNLETGLNEPSHLQILKNYANAILKIGGKKIYEDSDQGCYSLTKNGKDYRVKVSCINNSDFQLNVLELVPMKQEITASDMLDALNKDGFIALDILFDTGKSTIKPESNPIIDQITALMQLDGTLKISIEGHTDNVGDAAANKKLSVDRASSVMKAIIAKGVDKSRMTSTGWGQEKPVADNRTEEGRAKNRRVEIIKK